MRNPVAESTAGTSARFCTVGGAGVRSTTDVRGWEIYNQCGHHRRARRWAQHQREQQARRGYRAGWSLHATGSSSAVQTSRSAFFVLPPPPWDWGLLGLEVLPDGYKLSTDVCTTPLSPSLFPLCSSNAVYFGLCTRYLQYTNRNLLQPDSERNPLKIGVHCRCGTQDNQVAILTTTRAWQSPPGCGQSRICVKSSSSGSVEKIQSWTKAAGGAHPARDVQGSETYTEYLCGVTAHISNLRGKRPTAGRRETRTYTARRKTSPTIQLSTPIDWPVSDETQ